MDLDNLETINQAELGIPEFTTKTGNPDRAAILKSNHRIREGLEPGPRDFGAGGGFGRAQLRIPELDYAVIRRMFPELNSPDATTRTKAWKRFYKSPLSEKYRVTPRRGNRSRIIVP